MYCVQTLLDVVSTRSLLEYLKQSKITVILFCDLTKKALKRAFRAEAIKTDGITRPTYYVGLVVSVRFGSFLPAISTFRNYDIIGNVISIWAFIMVVCWLVGWPVASVGRLVTRSVNFLEGRELHFHASIRVFVSNRQCCMCDVMWVCEGRKEGKSGGWRDL